MGAYLRDKNFYYLDLLSNLFNIVSFCKLLLIWVAGLRSKNFLIVSMSSNLMFAIIWYYDKTIPNKKVLIGYHG